MDPNQEQQKRGVIDQLNRSADIAQRFRRRYGKGVAVKTALRKQAVKRVTISLFSFLFTNPVGWVILLIILIVFLFILIFFFFNQDALGVQPPANLVLCESVSGATCQPAGTKCPVVDGLQTLPDTSGTYTCAYSPAGSGTASGQQPLTCCLPPSRPGYFIPPFACGLKYWGLTYGPFVPSPIPSACIPPFFIRINGRCYHVAHEPWAVDFNRSPQDLGDPVRAVADGVVTFVDTSQGGVKIQHAGGYMSLYWHMMNIIVRKSQHVNQGQKIGEIDTNGNAYGSHLHFQELLNGNPTAMTFYGQPYVTGALASYLANPNSIPVSQTKILPDVTGSCP